MINIQERLKNFKINLPIPIFGCGCGVLGLSMAKVSINIGQHASTLLKALEYRGYDSTGAIFQDDKENIVLLKDVGAPSTLVKTLGIEKQAGKLFCGQVRWATFGFVNKVNAQPHEVCCKRHIYGAHNGNITNTRELKSFLLHEGHNVLSDNDGEMLVHTIEHYFDIEMDKAGNPETGETRKECMRKAIAKSAEMTIGSYAAVVADPKTETMWAIKAGSSLYFGIGTLDSERFALASSDLTAILRFTKTLVPFREGEFIEFTSDYYQIYAQKELRFKRLNQPDESYAVLDKISSQPVYSKLRAEDVELLPDFNYFMEQEIHAQPESTGKLIKLFQGGSNTGRRMLEFLNKEDLLPHIKSLLADIRTAESFSDKKKLFDDFNQSDAAETFYSLIQTRYRAIFDEVVKEDFEKKYFFSNEKNIFIDLLNHEFDKRKFLLSKALDSLSELDDVNEFDKSVQRFIELVKTTMQNNRNAYTIACGTSFHATKVAALFFNEIARFEIIPILPGDFRGEYSNCLKDNDLIIGVSQSGETKDLIDIFNDIDQTNLNIRKAVLVNNMNSTLGQEKSDVAIPILCGPEIAVPATKSFMNQITLFYYLAIKIAEMKLQLLKDESSDTELIAKLDADLQRRYKTLTDIPLLLKETIATTEDAIEYVAGKIYMEPSLHILATKISGVAMEGALKIRETVLNHAEGREASEFKHGPNTILGKNTVFGMKNIRSMVRFMGNMIDIIDEQANQRGISRTETKEILKSFGNYMFSRNMPFNLSASGTQLFQELIRDYNLYDPLYRNYPLLYVTGPDERDINLTVSQINTHKIRGADTFIIAEENDKLMKNASSIPNEGAYYGWGYITLPNTGDSLMTCFSATIALQLLALKMSVKKMTKLDRMNMLDHGVHPDVPKNVSKSITVD
jgi:glucosamine 6-phosphate synthetase-like amidotransferase/phosphosugar isomerase protein